MGTDLRTKAGRAAALARARRLGLLDRDSTGWHVGYLLAEAAVMPPSLARAAGAMAARAGGDGDAGRVLARLERAGWAEPVPVPRPAGRPPRRWRASTQGRIEMASINWPHDRRGAAGWCGFFLARALTEAGEDEVLTTRQLLAATRRSAARWSPWSDLPETSLRRELAEFARRGWVDSVVERRGVPPWRLTGDGLRVLAWLHRTKVPGSLPRPPRALTGAVREHDLRVARIAAALLPRLAKVTNLEIGRALDLDLGVLALTDGRRGGYCLPDLTVWTRSPQGGRRLVCVEVEAFASIPNLERHLTGYAALAETHLECAAISELVVAIVTRDRPARRAAVERVLATFPDHLHKWLFRVTFVTPGQVPDLCRWCLDDIDAVRPAR